MTRPVSRTPSAGALRMRQLQQRRAKGLQQLPQPWDWITAAQARDLVTKAFRAASWECREPDASPQNFAEALIQDFEVLIAAAAARAGHAIYNDSYPAMADRMLAEVPDYWRHQYPRFGKLPDQVDQDEFGGRSEAEGGGEAPLQSGARIE